MQEFNSKKFGVLYVEREKYYTTYICKECSEKNVFDDKAFACGGYYKIYCCSHLLCPKCYEKSENVKKFDDMEKENEELKKENELLKAHIRFSPGGEGALEALQSFLCKALSLEKNE